MLTLDVGLENGFVCDDLLRVDFRFSGGTESAIAIRVDTCGFQQSRVYEHDPSVGGSSYVVINPYALEVGQCDIVISVDGTDVCVTRRIFIRREAALQRTIANHLRSKKINPISFEGIDSAVFDYSESGPSPWFDRSDALEILSSKAKILGLSVELVRAIEDFVRSGYCILPFTIDTPTVSAARRDIIAAVSSGYGGATVTSSTRLEGLHHTSESINAIWKNASILKFLEILFEDKASPCQSLCFYNGSQQPLHQDSVYLTPFPRGYMCGVWVALEDVFPGSGELQYVPESHKIRRRYRRDFQPDVDQVQYENLVLDDLRLRIRSEGMTTRSFLPSAGQVLVWHEALMHGGGPRVDLQRSRISCVSHYFASSVPSYYDHSRGLAYKHDL